MIWVFICAHLVAQGLKDVLGADQANETTKSPQLCIAMDIEHRWIGAIMLDLLDHASKVTMLIDNENAPIHCRYCLSTHHCVKDYPELSKKRMPCPFISNVDMAYIWRNNIITCSIIIGNQGPDLCMSISHKHTHSWLVIMLAKVIVYCILCEWSISVTIFQPWRWKLPALGVCYLSTWVPLRLNKAPPKKTHIYTHTCAHIFIPPKVSYKIWDI